MQPQPNVVSSDFLCTQKTVWHVLSTPLLYDKWYTSLGNTQAEHDSAALSLGAKLKFRGKGYTIVVTAFEPARRLVLTTGTQTEEFRIRPTENGCHVSLSTTGHVLTHEELRQKNEELLTRLREVSYANMQEETAVSPILPRRRRKLQEFVAGMIQGYKTPLAPKSTVMADADEWAAVVDRTENDVVINARAGLVAVMCAVLLFTTLSFTSRFERSTRVPSSGMDLYISEDVNKTNASTIYIGQYISDLELMLNCVGTQLNATEYHYASPDGNFQLIVSYDAYGRVRQARFLDHKTAQTVADVPVLEAAAVLDAKMTLQQVEEAYGLPLSAFILDKSGVTTVYFGKLENVERMPTALEPDQQRETEQQLRLGLTAQAVVTLDATYRYTEAQYCLLPDIDNPLPTFEVTEGVKQQYNSNIESYRADRAAYERMYLLYGIQRTDAEIILNTMGDYILVEGAAGDILSTYSLRSRAVDEAAYRYLYTTQFDEMEEHISEVTILNRYLEQRSGYVPEAASYALTKNMPLYYVYAQLGILPTYAVLNGETLLLGFGARVADTKTDTRNFELCLMLDANTHLVTHIYDNR